MKKLLIKLALGFVLDVLIQYAKSQRDNAGISEIHIDRWNTIISFLLSAKDKGLPL